MTICEENGHEGILRGIVLVLLIYERILSGCISVEGKIGTSFIYN